MRNRVSDAINEEQRLFISLTDVLINDKDRSDFVADQQEPDRVDRPDLARSYLILDRRIVFVRRMSTSVRSTHVLAERSSYITHGHVDL